VNGGLERGRARARFPIALASLLAGAMLARLVWDLGGRDLVFGGIALAFYGLFLVAQSLQLVALWRPRETQALPLGRRLALALAVPVGLLGSIFDCMGLSFEGCGPTCAFLTRVVVPAVVLFAVLHALTDRDPFRLIALVLPFALLVPNCSCRNPVNASWIDLLGLSPACFLSGFTVTLVAQTALVSRQRTGLALFLAWGTNGVLMTFFVGHHYFHWPW